jgi:hypothetical protein
MQNPVFQLINGVCEETSHNGLSHPENIDFSLEKGGSLNLHMPLG